MFFIHRKLNLALTKPSDPDIRLIIKQNSKDHRECSTKRYSSTILLVITIPNIGKQIQQNTQTRLSFVYVQSKGRLNLHAKYQ